MWWLTSKFGWDIINIRSDVHLSCITQNVSVYMLDAIWYDILSFQGHANCFEAHGSTDTTTTTASGSTASNRDCPGSTGEWWKKII